MDRIDLYRTAQALEKQFDCDPADRSPCYEYPVCPDCALSAGRCQAVCEQGPAALLAALVAAADSGLA